MQETVALHVVARQLRLPAAEEGRPLVLIIDDDLAVRLMAKTCLIKSGFDVEEANCATEGLAKFEALQPDAVLCDVVMPDLDGYEVCERIRKSPGGTHVPIIMLTGLDDMESIEKAYSVGATEFTVKPINSSLLPRNVRFTLRASQAFERSQQSEERYALAARGANDGLWDWLIEPDTAYYSARWKGILGCDEDIGTSINDWLNRIASQDIERVRLELRSHLEGRTSHFESEYRVQCGDDSYKWVLSRGLAVRDEKRHAYRMAGSMTDISARKSAQEQLEHDALHDTLTRLPNRNLFLDRLSHCIEISKRRSQYDFAVLFMDLDRFKVVNDSMGHLIGDRMLIEVADRIRTALRTGDTLARFGGDEFTVLLEDVCDVGMATELAKRLQSVIAEPIELDGQQVVSSASMGVAMGGSGYELPDEMLRDADVAMYRAKSLGRGTLQVFNASMRMHAVHAMKTESELRVALSDNQILPKYQPIICLRSNKVAGFEALARWQSPTHGLVRPDQFMAVAEDSGLIVGIGRKVLEAACDQLSVWRKRWPKVEDWTMSVNISSQEVDQTDLVGAVDAVLEKFSLPARCLKLEITERSLIENDERALRVLNELHDRGVRLAIDDFGVGYSSLSYLHRFPFDDLKIDRSFITDVEHQPRRAELVKVIIQLAHNLGLEVTAEGAETEGSVEVLRALGCERVQGYYAAQPTRAEKLTQIFESQLDR